MDRLRTAVGSGRIDQPVVVVFEGQARLGVPSGSADGVTVLHAEGSGDDALVAVVAKESERMVTLVTADRELRRRVESLGAVVGGPSWLLDVLDA